MLRACVATIVAAALTVPVAEEARARDPDLAAGIALAKEGDFESALGKLDAAVRRMEAEKKPAQERAIGYLYLGVAYLELDQELSARSRFREAAQADPALRLDPREFSPQVIRFFESARQEVDAARAASTTQAAGGTPPAEPKKKGRSPLPFVLLGGGAVAGIAVAAAGDGSSSPTTPTNATTTTTTSTTTTTTTTTTPTTTTPPASCSYGMSPANQTVGSGGGTGTCSVTASPGSCRWTIETTDSWLTIASGGSGSGNGTVRWNAAPNSAGERKARLRVTQNHDARCEINQQPAPGHVAPSGATVSVSSVLDAPGASGQVVVDGLVAAFQKRGRARVEAAGHPGIGRVEAQLVSATGQPGTWTFEMGGSVEPGSLRVLAGDVTAVTADVIVFRIAGRAGERVVFTFRTKAP